MTFSEKIIQERKKRGWSQERLAQELNISRQAISKWETGQAYPDLETVICLSSIFNISIDELCGKDVNENKKNNKTYIFLAIIFLFVGMCFGSMVSFYRHNSPITLPEITDVSLSPENNGEIYIWLNYIDENAKYYILVDSSNEYRSYPRDGKLYGTLNAIENKTYEVSLKIKYNNQTYILPIVSSLRFEKDGTNYITHSIKRY